jgi:hypothetical protein
MSEKLQKFKVYRLVSLVGTGLITDKSFKQYFEGRTEKHNEKLQNEKIGYLYVKEKTDNYLIGDYTVLPDKNNHLYKNVDTAQYTPLEEKTKKTVGGYFPLFYIDLNTGIVFFQDTPEAKSFKDVFNGYLNSKEKIYLEDVYVKNPREEVKRLFGAFDEIEVLKIESENPINSITNIGKSIDSKIVLKKQIFKIKKECKFQIEEIVKDLLDETDLKEFKTLTIQGKDKNNNKLPYNVLKEAIAVKSHAMIDSAKFSIEKSKDYVLTKFKELHQAFQQSSST